MKVFIPVQSIPYEGNHFVNMDIYEKKGVGLMKAYRSHAAAKAVCDKLNGPDGDLWDVEEFDLEDED